jgi:CheY-like chemotaxis protein
MHDGRPSILVVDDDDDTRSCLMAVLEDEGYEVQGSSDGRDALRILNGSFEPDLVLLDLMMPVMNGWDVLDELAKVPRLAVVPVVVLTAAGDPASLVGKVAKPIVRKPIDLDLLLQLVKDCCNLAVTLDKPPSDLLPKVTYRVGGGAKPGQT